MISSRPGSGLPGSSEGRPELFSATVLEDGDDATIVADPELVSVKVTFNDLDRPFSPTMTH